MRYFSTKAFDNPFKRVLHEMQEGINKAVQSAESGLAAPQGGMLPSPASTMTAPSANSTPNNQSDDGRPKDKNMINNGVDYDVLTARAFGQRIKESWLPEPVLKQVQAGRLPPHVAQAVNDVRVGVDPSLLHDLSEVISDSEKLKSLSHGMQVYLNMPAVAKHFPRTFARMVHSTLQYSDEHEPDMEDLEGELLWPPQLDTGYGLGWCCLMARSIVEEYGQTVGYQGAKGLIVDQRKR
jgi:hypothetical protein